MAAFTIDPPSTPHRRSADQQRPAASTATRMSTAAADTTTCGLGSAAGPRQWRSLSPESSSVATAAGPVVIELPCPRITRREDGEPYIQPHRPFWLFDAHQREAILGSDAAFLASFAIAWVLSGVMAYFYALWTIGPF
jgi:hypothetical protein